jgi:phage tail-like protein
VDANLQRACQLADEADWAFGTGTTWEANSRVIRLVSARVPTWTEDTAAGTTRVAQPPGSYDRFNTRAVVIRTEVVPGSPRWSVVASGGAPGSTTLVADSAAEITDAAIGYDDVLYLALGDRVRLHDLRGRWADADVKTPAWRLAAAPAGCYVLAAVATGSPIGKVIGLPMRPLPEEYAADVFRPQPEDPDPPRYIQITTVPAGVTAAGIATSPTGALALLGWTATGNAPLYLLGASAFGPPLLLAGTTRPYSLTWVEATKVAVLVATSAGTTAAVYPTSGAGTVSPVGDLYPLRQPTGEPFFHGTELPPRYPSSNAVARPLVPVSWPSFVTAGEVTSATPVDGTATATTWHRIYLEAAIPAGTSIRVKVAASDERVAPTDDADWFEHRFGDPTGASPDVPLGTWLDAPSETPFHPGLLPCPAREGVAGLFTALVQRAGRRVRSLAGRYLWVKVDLVGDGRTTPELAALRLYAGRRGYAGLYLPELYREDTFGSEADLPAKATPADFLDRLLGTFESVLTPLEDQIASAWLLTTPKRVPDDAIDWLASWIGFVFAADLTIDRRRAMLERAWELYQRRGTLKGLALALELASNGAVSKGEVVLIEDFRLRRTFATILGVELDDPSDPLLPGLLASGNSLVGKTLFLGEDDQKSFLALFAPDLAIGTPTQIAANEDAITEFFDQLAYRATVLVHQEMEEQDLGLLQQIIDLEAPAHVEVKIVPAIYRFRVAVSSLVGVDTFLAPKPAPGPVTLDTSQLGVRDLILRLPSLDPRLGRTS